jgi:hypothetical protein
MRIKHFAVAVIGFTLACASASSGRPARNTNVITREEIANAHVYNAYDAVRMLRPQFLQSHGQTTITGSDTGYPRVYLNHQFYGDLESLRNLEVSGISEIHYYNGPDASNRFGLGNVSGAIEVITDAQ